MSQMSPIVLASLFSFQKAWKYCPENRHKFFMKMGKNILCELSHVALTFVSWGMFSRAQRHVSLEDLLCSQTVLISGIRFQEVTFLIGYNNVKGICFLINLDTAWLPHTPLYHILWLCPGN